jgi:ribonucleoside-diphosphate reductase alpha chain
MVKLNKGESYYIMKQFSENQMTLLLERYFLDKPDGSKETWEDLSMRTAVAIAKASSHYGDRNFEEEVKEYYEAILNFDFIPATPILMNAGTDKQQLFSCFVTQLQDNLESIYAELGLSAKIFSGAGGVGYDFGQLRPEGSKVSGRGISSGALSFMRLYDTSCGIIKIGSGSRRGAMLAALPVDHPEIMDFIKCKQNGKDFKNFNISVVITDEFMVAVKMDGEYELKSFKNNPEHKTLKARKVFNAIVNQAWKTGEPGILFLDAANKYNPTPKLGKYISSNPCISGDSTVITKKGPITLKELYLLSQTKKPLPMIKSYNEKTKRVIWQRPVRVLFTKPDTKVLKLTFKNSYNSHTLVCTPDHKIFDFHVNSYIAAEKWVHGGTTLDVNNDVVVLLHVDDRQFSSDVYDITMPVHHNFFADGVLVANCGEVVGVDGSVCCLGHVNFATIVKDGKIDYKELERRIRLGIRFLDNCIDVNKYPHDKFKKVSLATRTIGLGFAGFADLLVQLNIRYGSHECFKLINEIGAFFQETSHDESFQIALKRNGYPAFEGKTPLRRNASTNTIAPTGSTAMIADCSYGVEPYFALAFIKNCMDGKQLVYGNAYFENYLNTLTPEVKEEVLKYAQLHGTLHGIDKKLLPDYILDTFVTAHDIEPRDRVKVQATWQKYIDLSISSTVNLPESATKEDVAEIYRLAWDYGCKGITVYRNNSRSQQVLNIEKVKNTWTCENCGHIETLDDSIDPTQVCIKCPKCTHKSCA